jgi:hypothetical protein
VRLSDPVNAVIVGGEARGTIIDDDDPEPVVVVGDGTVGEGHSGTQPLVFRVSLLMPSPLDVAVRFATSNGTARAGTDFVATNGGLTFPAGQTNRTVSVSVIGDRGPEPTERFFLRIVGASNAPIADGVGIGTIVDDDGGPSDVDGDGLPDAWEYQYFGSTSAARGGPGDDPDGDGCNNRGEWIAGTSPLDAADAPDLRAVTRVMPARAFAFAWNTVTGRFYTVESRPDLSATSRWSAVTGWTNRPGTAGSMAHTNSTPAGRLFYRLKVWLP